MDDDAFPFTWLFADGDAGLEISDRYALVTWCGYSGRGVGRAGRP